MTDVLQNKILYALYCMSRDTMAIDAGSPGRVTGSSATDAAASLVALELAGLVDATRARLTMLGLAKAAAAGADLGGTGIDLGAAPAPVEEQVAPPLAAAPATPSLDYYDDTGEHPTLC